MKSPRQQLAEKRRDETVAHLWTCYRKDRDNSELRNRLVEHYTPLAQQFAALVRRYQLREVETAIGDALLLLMMRIVPKYDGESDFRRWALVCIRQKMLQRRKKESLDRRRFVNRADCEKEWPDIEAQLICPDKPGSDVRFVELTAALPPRGRGALAAVLSPRQFARSCRGSRRDPIGREQHDSRRDRHAAAVCGGKSVKT